MIASVHPHEGREPPQRTAWPGLQAGVGMGLLEILTACDRQHAENPVMEITQKLCKV